jgi:hypothetical protein
MHRTKVFNNTPHAIHSFFKIVFPWPKVCAFSAPRCIRTYVIDLFGTASRVKLTVASEIERFDLRFFRRCP